jgi:hypothetical protein
MARRKECSSYGGAICERDIWIIYFLYIKNNVNNNKLIIKLIIPAIISELSDIKYPCNNYKRLVIKNIIREYNDKSSTLFDIYVLCNCGNNCIQLNR